MNLRSLLRTRTILVALLLISPLVWGSLDGAFAQHRLAADLDAYIAKAQKDWPVPGLAVAIVKDGEVLLSKGYGSLRLDGSQPVDEHTLFAIASNTKAFTSAALAILVDEGALSWDDRVVDHLPYFRLYDDYATSEIRIRDLLTHRAGFRNYSGDLVWYGTDYPAEEVLRRLRHLEPSFPFRARYGYANIMYIAAGEVVSRVSGVPFNRFVKERILDPLGMSRTTLEDEHLDRLGNVATPHRERDGETIPLEWFAWESSDAAGGIASSVHDMSRWLRLQLGRGSWDGVTVFTPDRSEEMWSPQTVMPISSETRELYPSIHFQAYGLGWVLQDYHGRKVIMHGGGYDGMFSRVAMVPEENLGLVVLTNAMTGISNDITYRILDTFLGAEQRSLTAILLPRYLEDRARFLERQREVMKAADGVSLASPTRDLAGYAGTYFDPLYGDVTVTGPAEKGRALEIRFQPNPDLVGDLQHLHTDTFTLTWRKDFAWFDGGVVQFLTHTDGRIYGMRVEIPNEDFWFEELELSKVTQAGQPRQ